MWHVPGAMRHCVSVTPICHVADRREQWKTLATVLTSNWTKSSEGLYGGLLKICSC